MSVKMSEDIPYWDIFNTFSILLVGGDQHIISGQERDAKSFRIQATDINLEMTQEQQLIQKMLNSQVDSQPVSQSLNIDQALNNMSMSIMGSRQNNIKTHRDQGDSLDESIDRSSAIPILDSTVSRQNKNNRMKLNVKLSKAKENTKRDAFSSSLIQSQSMPSLKMMQGFAQHISSQSLISSNHTNITRTMVETQVSDHLQEKINTINNVGVIPNEQKPSKYYKNLVSSDEIILFHYNKGNLQVYKVYLDEQSEQKEISSFNLKIRDSLSCVHHNETSGEFFMLRKHSPFKVESLDQKIQTPSYEEYISREDYQARMNETTLDPEQFKQLYTEVRSQQIIEEEKKRGGDIPNNFHSRLLEEPHVSMQEIQEIKEQRDPEGDKKFISFVKESQQRLQQPVPAPPLEIKKPLTKSRKEMENQYYRDLEAFQHSIIQLQQVREEPEIKRKKRVQISNENEQRRDRKRSKQQSRESTKQRSDSKDIRQNKNRRQL